MADSGFADTIRRAVSRMERVVENSDRECEQMLVALDREEIAALAGLEAERDELRDLAKMATRNIEYADREHRHAEALAAVLETTREALTRLAAVIQEADDNRTDFAFVPDIIKAVGVSDVAYDGAGWYANAAAELTRRYGASIIPAADQGGQNA